MKLKDLVANSLPRVRGRKKKAPVAVCAAPSATEAAAKGEIITSRVSSDKGEARLQPQSCRNDSRDDSFELQGITEASWRGNALYRGLEAARAVKFNSKLMSTSYTSSHGMVTSHSAEGFSTQMMMMSRSYDSRMTVPDCSDSCPQMMSVCETHLEPFSSPQQYYHCHYHQHSHHHYHHHHLHPKPMTPLAQNQQKLHTESASAGCPTTCKTPGEDKPEQGFFRKSFASFRSMRKHSSKSNKDLKHNGVDKTVCSVCPYPEATAAPTEKKSTDKRPAKPKRKSLKGLSKHKENKEIGQSDKSWYSDNDTHNVVSQVTRRNDPGVSVLATRERPHDRERSVESCSSRLYGSREGSCVREVDFTGFDSASLSGYESDLSRGKIHRSRSRIKTNPWLPSPQPSMSGGGRSEKFDLRESTEDVVKLDEPNGRFPRSASFEHQRCATLSLHTSVQKDSNENKVTYRPRSVTPSDTRLATNLTPHGKTTSNIVKPTWWSVNQVSDESFSLKKMPRPKVEVFNDLNSTASKSRPSSTVSPNSEFVMLADNLEQLANNISFEYEEMLDTTLESVSICQEDGQTSIQELFTDEENVEVSKSSLKSDGDLHNAHSPDSGVGGLGSTDGDENVVSNSQRLQTDVSMDSLSHAGSMRCFDNPTASDSNLETTVCSKAGYSRKDKSSADMKCSRFLLSGACDYNTQTASPKLKIPRDKLCMLDTSSSATLTESDIDNTSYHEVSHNELQHSKKKAITLDGKQHNSLSLRHEPELNCTSKRATLMVDERLDIQFQPAHRQFHGCGIIMGTGGALHDHSQQMGATGKQMLWKASDSPALFTCRHPRPCAFKTSNGLPVARRMNDIEKGSGQGQQRRSWSVEFDIPRNITITECVESPTENWQCVEGFSGGRNSEAYAHSHIIPQKSAQESSAMEPEICESSFLQNEELVVNLSAVVATGHCKHMRNNSSDVVSRMDCSSSKLTTESDSVCSEMNDACVQTDFDEDFSRWEEAETLESLEDKALDPAESTRLWLLTGNMHDSADTGYSSLTRESQIFMDEDTLLLAGEVEETAAAERLSFVESSDRVAITEMGSKDADCHDKDPCKGTGFDDKYQSSEASRYAVLAGKEQLRQHPGRVSKTGYEKELLSDEHLQRSNFCCQQATHTPRTIPQSTVHRMFSNIESQFQEIFQKIYEDKTKTNSETKRTSSDSSDSTLKSSNSDDLEDSAVSKNTLEYVKTKDSDTGERKACRPPGVSKDKGFPNTASMSSVSKGFLINGAKLQAQCTPHAPEATANKSVEFAKPNHELQSQCCTRSPFLKAAVCSPNASSLSPVPVSHERADYLEFLRDAPLDRLHLKRPLFLVPGVGPVDMSSSEQLNLFADTGMPCKNSPVPCSTVPFSSSPSSMSPSTAHCGKKVKYKKGEYQTTPDYARSKERVAKQHNPASLRLTNNNSSLTQRQEQPMAPFKSKDYPVCNPSAPTCGGRPAINEILNLPQNRSINPAASAAKHQHPAPPLLLPSSTKTSLSDNKPTAPDDRRQKDAAIRNMTERVICLRREKDMVFQKIQEVRQDERLRHQHQLQMQKQLHTQRKEALLETLNDLKHKLEQQSKLLKKKDDPRGPES
ncbi:hypothetical protein BsWGS_24062 [Bradybaena similaris]